MTDELQIAVRALEAIREIWVGSECGDPVYAQEAYAINLCKEMYKEAVQAIALVRDHAERGWENISTAPKDGTRVLLAGRWLSGNWEVAEGQWLVNRFNFVGDGQPSHWMPLPLPPERAEPPEARERL